MDYPHMPKVAAPEPQADKEIKYPFFEPPVYSAPTGQPVIVHHVTAAPAPAPLDVCPGVMDTKNQPYIN